MTKPISKQILRAQRELLRDQLNKKNEQISDINVEIGNLQGVKAGYITEKDVILSNIADLNEDIG